MQGHAAGGTRCKVDGGKCPLASVDIQSQGQFLGIVASVVAKVHLDGDAAAHEVGRRVETYAVDVDIVGAGGVEGNEGEQREAVGRYGFYVAHAGLEVAHHIGVTVGGTALGHELALARHHLREQGRSGRRHEGIDGVEQFVAS